MSLTSALFLDDVSALLFEIMPRRSSSNFFPSSEETRVNLNQRRFFY